MARSPCMRLLAGVFSNSSLMQKTRPERTTVRSFHFRCSTIFSRGTRSPAPHHAASTTSGAASATSSADVVLPGSPTNVPPAHSTNSATHGCDAISGLPHSSQKTRGRGPSCTQAARISSIAVCMFAYNLLAAFRHAHESGQRRDIGVDISQCSRGETKEADSNLQDFDYRFRLVGHRRNDQVGLGRPNLVGLGGPGVGHDAAACHSATSGQTSTQYFVQATTRSSSPMSRIVRVALGCRQTTRRGVKSEGTVGI